MEIGLFTFKEEEQTLSELYLMLLRCLLHFNLVNLLHMKLQ